MENEVKRMDKQFRRKWILKAMPKKGHEHQFKMEQMREILDFAFDRIGDYLTAL